MWLQEGQTQRKRGNRCKHRRRLETVPGGTSPGEEAARNRHETPSRFASWSGLQRVARVAQ